MTRWQQVPRVVRATTAILRAHEAANNANARTAVDLGRRIIAIRDALEHGEFLAWIAEAVPFGERTVRNYMALAEWADREPKELDRLAHLGPSKLYRLAALPVTPRKKLVLRTPIRIPGNTGRAKTIETMTVAELDRVLGGVVTPPVPRTPVAKIVQGYRFRLASLGELTHTLIGRAREVDRAVASDLAAELRNLAESLEAAFRR